MKNKTWAYILIIIVVLIVLSAFIWKIQTKENGAALSEAEARIIAEKSCIKGGEALDSGVYNENSKTWWFDANLNSVREGCTPACVVSEETKTAEINWSCTGLIEPENPPTKPECTCQSGYRKDGEACNPECYYSSPPCLAPSIPCQSGG